MERDFEPNKEERCISYREQLMGCSWRLDDLTGSRKSGGRSPLLSRNLVCRAHLQRIYSRSQFTKTNVAEETVNVRRQQPVVVVGSWEDWHDSSVNRQDADVFGDDAEMICCVV